MEQAAEEMVRRQEIAEERLKLARQVSIVPRLEDRSDCRISPRCDACGHWVRLYTT